ncbi:MAG: FG-GAP-like repeat-containing protein [Vicinamibacterales bacterium]
MGRPLGQRLALVRLLVTLALASSACGGAPPSPAPPDPALVGATNAGLGHLGQFDFPAAVDAFSALAATHPDSAETALNLAIALVNRQRPEDAADAERRLRAVIDAPGVGTRARYVLGLLLLYQGRDADALPLLEAVAAEAPRDGYAAYFAGQASLAGSPEAALAWFDTAQSADPLLRSAAYGAFQALQRLGRGEDAAARLAAFQALERDPRAHLAEFKYTRMGPLAEAVPIEAPLPPAAVPDGAPFLSAARLVSWPAAPPAGARSITAADIDGDGTTDVFVAGAGTPPAANLVVLHRGDRWEAAAGHPLASVPDVRAALWGDLDNDGRTDVVLVRGSGHTALWRQGDLGAWRDVTAASRATTRVDAVDGALVDADHDGDLDIWLTNAGGPNELLNNNGDGTFRPIAAEAGVAGDGRPSVGVAIVDLDGDRDHDIVVLKATPPHDVFLNDRVWQYHRAGGYEAFEAAAATALLAADLDADGRAELYTTSARGLERWSAAPGTAMASRRLAPPAASPDRTAPARLALADVNGDGAFELLASAGDTWRAYAVPTTGEASPVFEAEAPAAAWAVATTGDARGPSVVASTGGGVAEWAPGPGRGAYVTVAVTGRSQSSDQRRSNVSGVGTKVVVRTGARWTAFDTARLQSGPGQSLQPVAVGLGGASRADLVSLTWSDGVLQSEIGLEAGRRHVIEETQRQLSSCPVLFADDGTATRFVTDLLGVGGIGFFERPGVYADPWPREHVLLPEGALGTRGGRHRLVIGEPMEEVAYFDQFELAAYDLPPGWQMALDERKSILSAPPTGAPVFFREERLPARAVNDRGDDVTTALATADLVAAPPGAVDARFIGLTSRHAVELTFADAVERGPGRPVLVIDGWLEYPYAQTIFAAWQAQAAYEAPTLEARDRQGRWRVVAREFGYPAGMPRRMTLPLDGLPTGTVGLRISTTQEIYWDRIAVAYAAVAPQAVERVLPLVSATLAESGFARRTTGLQRTPFYDYGRRTPLWDTRYPRGWYTRYGDVAALVRHGDDAVAVVGPGEEVAVEFAALDTPPAAGWTRRYVLRARGWCKDMDLYTKDGDTVEPMPGTPTPAARRLQAEFTTRYEGGR